MRNFKNTVHVEGYVFGHTLEKRVSAKGVEYIRGDIQVAVDENAMNVVSVSYIYETETFNSGTANSKWPIMMKLINGAPTYQSDGQNAMKVRIDSAIGINDFIGRDGNMVSAKRPEGGFIHELTGTPNFGANFDVDMLIAGTAEKEVEDGDDYLTIRGYVFNFRNDLVPVDFNVRDKGGIKYFQDEDISNANPMLTNLWGNIISTTIETKQEVESAWGAPSVNVSTRTVRSWDIVGCAVTQMDLWDEDTITQEEFKAKMQARQEHLADVKQRHDEYQANRGGNSFTSELPFDEKPKQKATPTSMANFEF